MTTIVPVQHQTIIRPQVGSTLVNVSPSVTEISPEIVEVAVNPACSCPACAGAAEGGDLTLAYDVDGRLVSVTDTILGVTTLTYDGGGLLVSVVDPDSTVALQYDVDDRLVAVLTN